MGPACFKNFTLQQMPAGPEAGHGKLHQPTGSLHHGALPQGQAISPQVYIAHCANSGKCGPLVLRGPTRAARHVESTGSPSVGIS